MKLLFIGNVGYRFNSFVLSSSIAARQLGIEFHVAGHWTGYDDPKDKIADEEKYGVIIHQIDFVRSPYNPQNIKAYKQIVELIQKEKYDIIHCNTPIGGVVGRLAGKKCGVKTVIYQAHGFHFYKGAPLANWILYYPIEKFLAHYTNVMITINREDFQRAKSFRLRNNGKVYYIPGVGIDTSLYHADNTVKTQKREELKVPLDKVLIISVGDLNKNKNNCVVIDAIKTIPEVYYILCGDGPLKKQLQEQAQGVEDKVRFLGFRNDIKELLAASDIFVLPSLREGLSRSLMEAMATKLPCVASRIRGNTDLLGVNDFLCDATSVDEFTVAISKLSSSVELRRSVGEINGKRVQSFSTEKVVEGIKDIYKTCY